MWDLYHFGNTADHIIKYIKIESRSLLKSDRQVLARTIKAMDAILVKMKDVVPVHVDISKDITRELSDLYFVQAYRLLYMV